MGRHSKNKGENDWTLEQRLAIDWRGSNVLVSAGAGSGKTRVLVERIIRFTTDLENPEEMDGFLVVTFTNAAAAEMKHRIYKALLDVSRSRPESTHLRRQQILLNRASICTIHSFCMEVLKQYYYLLDLDPTFRVVDQTEGELLRQEVLEEVLESYYLDQEETSSFYQLVESCSSERGDDVLKNLVFKLYDFSRSHPQPREWLREKADSFRIRDDDMLEQTPWVEILLKDCLLELEGMIQQLSQAEVLCSQPGGPVPYLNNFIKEKEMLGKCLASGASWEELARAVNECSFERLKICKGEDYEESLKAKAQNLRDKVKKNVKRMHEELFQQSLEDYAQEIKEMSPLIEALVDLVNSFEEKYSLVKKEKGLVDFSDLEHYTLKILGTLDTGTGKIIPSEAALYYQSRFNHVMVDEYQDINMVQEAIIGLVSRGQGKSKGRVQGQIQGEAAGMEQGQGTAPNLFMVGDVKQSIYRFRLAEPELFLNKLTRYKQNLSSGKTIVLNKNFRSRPEVLEGVNFLFRKIMDEAVGEIIYDQTAELTCGKLSSLPLQNEEERGGSSGSPFLPEIVIISRREQQESASSYENSIRNGPVKAVYRDEKEEGEEQKEESETEHFLAAEETESALLEARYIAEKIKEFTGQKGKPPFQIYCKKQKIWRLVTYRDMVILLRSAPNWTSTIMEELQKQEIPAYAEQGSGYFDAAEVEVIVSLLRVVDNPYQDIPLASVLRSPLVGLSAEEMAIIRAENKRDSFYDALKGFTLFEDFSFINKIETFLQRLKKWQSFVHRGELGELIWHIYQETGYYDLVGGIERGRQRQANLRALYDRARQYESTSFRGLFRFLRFIEKLKDLGGDLGTAPALGEQENVVRIMTIHKSKGLEFPVVFLAGLGRQFNRRDLQGDFLLHKNLGFGPKRINMDSRIIYPTLPQLAVKKRLALEMLSEEMRILYVAVTRAEDKLIMVGSVNNYLQEVDQWSNYMMKSNDLEPNTISSYARASAKRYLDWIGPSILCPQAEEVPGEVLTHPGTVACGGGDASTKWKITILSSAELCANQEDRAAQEVQRCEQDEWVEKIKMLEPVPLVEERAEAIARNLSWSYPYLSSTLQPAKMSVSELKSRSWEPVEDDFWMQDLLRQKSNLLHEFSSSKEKGLTRAERGTAYHIVMQKIDLKFPFSKESIDEQLAQMVEQGLLRDLEKESINTEEILKFFLSPLGERMKEARSVFREVPFTLSVPPEEILANHKGEEVILKKSFHKDDRLIIQGVIDCILEEKEGLVIIDYKSDDTSRLTRDELIKKYRYQLEQYGKAAENIWKVKVTGMYLYFFNSSLILSLKGFN